MSRIRTLIALLLIARGALAAQTPPGVSGTYAMWICEKACTARDTATSSQYGYIVLDDYGLDLSSIPVAARTRIHRKSVFAVPLGQINACYSYRLRRPPNPTYTGSMAASHGLTVWSRKGDSVSLNLDATPDSWYTMYAVQRGDVLSGIGWALGSSGTHYSHQAGFILARRIGAADIRKCFPENLVKEYESHATRLDGDEFAIMRVLERRDEGLRKHDARLAASAYSMSAMITDRFGAIHGFRRPVVRYFDSTLTRAGNDPAIRRRDWPRIHNSGELAYVEEYFETTRPAFGSIRQPVIQRSYRISLLDNSDGSWHIGREITLDAREDGASRK